MDIYALNKDNTKEDSNNNKWTKLHKEFSKKVIRTKVNYAIKQIESRKNIIDTKSEKFKTLEVGCGFGRNLSYLLEKNFSDEYIGIDMTDTAIEQSSKLLSRYIKKGILTIAKGNAGEKINYPDNYFDCVYDIMSAITFIVDEDQRKKYFSEVTRVLKPGGVYFFLTARKDGVFKDIFDDDDLLKKRFVKRKFDSMLERIYSYDELVSLLDGLDLISLEIASSHTRAFGDEEFIRENGFWLGSFRKPAK